MLSRRFAAGALISIVLTAAVAACNGPINLTEPQSPTSEPTAPTKVPLVTPRIAASDTTTPLEANPTVTAAPFVQPTEPPPNPSGCPPAPAEVPISPIEDVANYGDELLRYLNAGGSLDALAAYAGDQHLLGEVGVGQAIAQPDLDGDGVVEQVISLVDYASADRVGMVYVLMCRGGSYRLEYSTGDRIDYPTAQIYATFDATGDGLDDVLIQLSGCGAHTCFKWLEVVSWGGTGLDDRMADTQFYLPSTSIQVFGPMTDGSAKIVMTGNGVASVGAGPYRRQQVTWEWQSQAGYFRPMELRNLPSEYRIHQVQDGDRSYTDGNYAAAIDYYNRAINDSSLRDWPTAAQTEDYVRQRRLEVQAYARFRRVLARLKLGDQASAEVHFQDLLDHHPPGEHGDGFAAMGREFWAAYLDSGEFSVGCTAAQQFAEANPERVIRPLDHGYENPIYTPEGLCPLTP